MGTNVRIYDAIALGVLGRVGCVSWRHPEAAQERVLLPVARLLSGAHLLGDAYLKAHSCFKAPSCFNKVVC